MASEMSQTKYLGGAWYPEHWPESRWPVDLELMQAAGMNVVRIGDYAWSRLEPAEGQFRTEWMERAVELARQFEIRTVISTPTDAPPAWLTQKYPEVLRVEPDGRRTTHGGRRHFNPLHPKFREFSAKIAAVLADRFGKHPYVLGWQIGNEFCRYSHDEVSRGFFQEWLRKKYKTLDELNRRWTTSYWSQEYSDWSQIHIPAGWQNPCLDLDYFRFISDGFADFQRIQIAAIRARAQDRQWVTTNMHGCEDLDFSRIIEDADIAAWDPYPPSHTINHLEFGWISDFCRTIKSRPHWIMETQCSYKNWAPPNCSMPRGVLRGMTWHFFGHGSEAVLYWQWRSALGGQEQYHGTALGPDGNPRAPYAELATIGRELRKMEPVLAGMRMTARVAIVYSYVNQSAVHRQRHHPDFDPQKHMLQYYGALRSLPLNVDVIQPKAALDGYRLLIAPHLHCLDAALVEKLIEYARGGGHLLLGARSGFKDEFNALLPSRQPGVQLAELLGAYVDEHHTLDRPVEVSGKLGAGTATIWAEYLVATAPDVEILLNYGTFNGWIDGKPAMVSRQVGRGRITYVGAWLAPELMQAVMRWATHASDVFVHFPTPSKHVEVCCLAGNGSEACLVINHGPAIEHVELPRPMKDALSESGAASSIDLPAYGVSILVNA